MVALGLFLTGLGILGLFLPLFNNILDLVQVTKLPFTPYGDLRKEIPPRRNRSSFCR